MIYVYVIFDIVLDCSRTVYIAQNNRKVTIFSRFLLITSSEWFFKILLVVWVNSQRELNDYSVWLCVLSSADKQKVIESTKKCVEMKHLMTRKNWTLHVQPLSIINITVILKLQEGLMSVFMHLFKRASETTIKYCRPRVGVVRGHCMVSGGRREWTK